MIGDLHPSSTHPPLPPTTEDIRFQHLRLLRSRRVGASTYHRLIAEHGSAQAALDALPQIAADAGVSDYEICPESAVIAELNAARKSRARLLLHGHADYPDTLSALTDAPPALWAIGDLSVLTRPMVAFVGARNASALGIRMATAIARDLSDAGYVIVSGLARGIDAAVHKAALSGGTIAVQAGGANVTVPSETRDLAAQIVRGGLRLSEQPLGTQPLARHFPARNRVIAGLGQACVLVEAALKSGSLTTARDVSDLGRDVLAVPGHPFDARSAGCNALIRDGAILVRGAQDVIEALQPIAQPSIRKLNAGDPVSSRLSDLPVRTVPTSGAPPSHQSILERLGPDPVAIDHLIRTLKARPDALSPVLTELELDGHIKRHAGGLLSRCS